MKHENLLIVADSNHDANMRYAVGWLVPVPFIFLRLENRAHVVLPDLELQRLRRRARGIRLVSLNQCVRRLHASGQREPGFAAVIRHILEDEGVRKVQVPDTFPIGLARELRRLRIKLKVRPNPFFPERQSKSASEVKKISAALVMAEVGLAEGIHALRNARIGKDNRLMLRQTPLTAERLRSIIETAVLQAGGTTSHSVVAGARQSADPHEVGHGPLRAHSPIILEVFPKSQQTGYWGSIARTVVKGSAPEAVRNLYYGVHRALELAITRIRSGKPAGEVHESVSQFFVNEGFRRRRRAGLWEGFLHPTGHGIGLEIGEHPMLAHGSHQILRPGHVVAVRPGLYYREVGGVRLEDVILVTSNGARNLTKFERTLEV